MGRRKEDPSKVKKDILRVRLDHETMVSLDRISELTRRSKSDIIRELIKEEIEIVDEMNRLGRFK